jgi:hypothetical protein
MKEFVPTDFAFEYATSELPLKKAVNRVIEARGGVATVVRFGNEVGTLDKKVFKAALKPELSSPEEVIKTVESVGLHVLSVWTNKFIQMSIVDDLAKKNPNTIVEPFDDSDTGHDDFAIYAMAVHPEFPEIYVINNTDIKVDFDAARTSEVTKIVHELDSKLMCMKELEIEVQSGQIYTMVPTQNGPQFMSIGRASIPLERGNYEPETIELYDRMVEELNSHNPRGRLSILNGPPGTGKTHMVQALLNDIEFGYIVLVPHNDIRSVSEPEGVMAMLKLKKGSESPIVLIVEDGDDAVAPREEGGTSMVTALLNVGDGIVGKMLNVRVVVTTNREHQNFDRAVLRPGRLSTQINVGPLSGKTASAVFKRLTGKTEKLAVMTIAEVYQMAFDSGWAAPAKTQKSKMGFTSGAREELINSLDTSDHQGNGVRNSVPGVLGDKTE